MDFIDNISSPFDNYENEILGWPTNLYEIFSSNEFESNTFFEKICCNEQIQSKRRFLYIF